MRSFLLILFALSAAFCPTIASADDTTCAPQCRRGFVCVEGKCVSPCNPPCGSSEMCGADAECHRLSNQHWDDSAAEAVLSSEEESKKREGAPKYERSLLRLYAGPAVYGLPAGGRWVASGGATLVVHVHPDDARMFLLGARMTAIWDSNSYLLQGNADIGLRFYFVEAHRVGVGFVMFITPGAAFLAGNTIAVGAFHFGGLLGPAFDFGPFTFETLLGPGLLVQKGAVGVLESTFEVGARF